MAFKNDIVFLVVMSLSMGADILAFLSRALEDKNEKLKGTTGGLCHLLFFPQPPFEPGTVYFTPVLSVCLPASLYVPHTIDGSLSVLETRL